MATMSWVASGVSRASASRSRVGLPSRDGHLRLPPTGRGRWILCRRRRHGGAAFSTNGETRRVRFPADILRLTVAATAAVVTFASDFLAGNPLDVTAGFGTGLIVGGIVAVFVR